jgi:hypothetical protein
MSRFLICALVCLSLAVPVRAAEPGGPFVPARDQAELHARLKGILRENHTPGMAVALANREGIVWAAGIGLADVSTGQRAHGRLVTRDFRIRCLVGDRLRGRSMAAI